MKNELRIGNYINNYNKVLSITDGGLVCTGLSIIGVVIIENPKPIPLTEQILLKCGFKLYHSGSYCIDLFNENEYLAIDVKYNKGFVYIIIDDNSLKVNLEYLHQLQNLYFALTNEELTVNL